MGVWYNEISLYVYPQPLASSILHLKVSLTFGSSCLYTSRGQWYKRLRNCVTTSLRTAKSHFFEELTSKLSQPKDFWSALQKLSPKQDQLPFDLHLNRTTASTTQDKVDLLNSYFSSCFTPATNTLSHSNIPPHPNLPVLAWKKMSYSHDEVFKYLSTWKTNTVTGPDGISSQMIHGTVETNQLWPTSWISLYKRWRFQMIEGSLT